jgi:hypothetical protein
MGRVNGGKLKEADKTAANEQLIQASKNIDPKKHHDRRQA